MRTTIELKKEIIAKFENGVRVSDLATQYGMAKSTISTFLKNKDAIKAADVAKGVTSVVCKQRPQIIDKIEKLLVIFIKEKEIAGNSISEGIICEKALEIYNDLLKETPCTSVKGESAFTFKASRGWFEKFKHRSGIHSVTRHEKAASSNKEVAVKYIADNVNAEGFLPQQLFSYDETGLFWKKMSSKTYITKEEKALPWYKHMKARK